MKIEISTVRDRDEALANYKKIVEMEAQMESSSNDSVYGVTYRPNEDWKKRDSRLGMTPFRKDDTKNWNRLI